MAKQAAHVRLALSIAAEHSLRDRLLATQFHTIHTGQTELHLNSVYVHRSYATENKLRVRYHKSR